MALILTMSLIEALLCIMIVYEVYRGIDLGAGNASFAYVVFSQTELTVPILTHIHRWYTALLSILVRDEPLCVDLATRN